MPGDVHGVRELRRPECGFGVGEDDELPRFRIGELCVVSATVAAALLPLAIFGFHIAS